MAGLKDDWDYDPNRSNPYSCTLWIPTDHGRIPAEATDVEVCQQYQLHNHNFCALHPNLRANYPPSTCTPSSSSDDTGGDPAVYYTIIAGVFGVGLLAACIVTAMLFANRWGRRANKGASCW
ncbi:uncharacterized protein GGS25DRAFT_520994 [Hypoxylon fragiforme]|uniref:uncharacterized protein n=1 Tax=Hypoxylon fragiforme TaxID=63214 RepID=UPI0020C5E145|nr:uncharacterized protein GGS25DRAFT_520994 [Hypoxylon fragiforme]KAI2610185.1 hypothetical protein GGS25DRAFT_520994 [Hypoxylon fragiforme]